LRHHGAVVSGHLIISRNSFNFAWDND